MSRGAELSQSDCPRVCATGQFVWRFLAAPDRDSYRVTGNAEVTSTSSHLAVGSRLPAAPRSEVHSVLAHFRHTIEDFQESPGLSDRRQSLKVILILDPALHPELGQERYHLSDRDSRKLGSSTKRSIAFLISFHREQDSAPGDHVPHGLGKITSLFFCELVQEFTILTIHSDAHRLRHVAVSSWRLASSRIDFL
jgi:hypothetical protein